MSSGQQNQLVESEKQLGNSSLYSQYQPKLFNDDSNFQIPGQFTPRNISLDQLKSMADEQLDNWQVSQFERIDYEYVSPSQIFYPQEQPLENISNSNKIDIEEGLTTLNHILNYQFQQRTFQTQINQHDQNQQLEDLDENQLCTQLLGLSNIPPQLIRSQYLSRRKVKYVDRKIQQLAKNKPNNHQFLLKAYSNNNFELFQKYRFVFNKQKQLQQEDPNKLEEKSTLNLSLIKFQMAVFCTLNWNDLIELNLSTCFLNDKDWEKLVENFKNFPQLKEIYLRNNMITDIRMNDIQKMTNSASSLVYINLQKNPLNMFSIDQMNKTKQMKSITILYDNQLMKLDQSRNEQIEEFSRFLESQFSCFTFQSVEQIKPINFVDFQNKMEIKKGVQAETEASSMDISKYNAQQQRPFFAVKPEKINFSFQVSDIHQNQNHTIVPQFSLDNFTKDLIQQEISTMILNQQSQPQNNDIRQIWEKIFSNGLFKWIEKYFDDFKTNMIQKKGLKSDDNKLDKIFSDQIDKFKEQLTSEIKKQMLWAVTFLVGVVVLKTIHIGSSLAQSQKQLSLSD